MSVLKLPFLTLLPIFFSGFIWLMPPAVLADLSMKPRTCSNCSGFGSQSPLNHQHPSHRPYSDNSFKYPGAHQYYHDKPHYHPYQPYFDGYQPYYRHQNGIHLEIVAPVIHSGTYYNNVSPRPYSPEPVTQHAPAPNQRNLAGQKIDAWTALGNYQTDQALDGFAYQSQQNPQNAVPKVGYALATALTGEYDKAAWAMGLALKANVTDLHYFQADANMQLVLEDILMSYSLQPIMRATILYLQQDYLAADKAVSESLNNCRDCRGEQNLQDLIHRKLS